MLKFEIVKEDMFVKVENELWDNKSYSNEDIVIYCIIKRFVTVRGYCKVSINDIYDILRFTNGRETERIRQSLSTLQEKDLIGCYDRYYNSIDIEKVRRTEQLFIAIKNVEDNYFPVYDSDMDKVIEYSSQHKLDKFSFIRYYITLCRVTNDNNKDANKIGFLTQKQVGNVVVNRNIVAKYNEILSELKIFHYNNNYVSATTGKNLSTFFGKCSDVDKFTFDKEVEVIAKRKGYVYVSKEKQSEVRKKGMKKNTIADGHIIDTVTGEVIQINDYWGEPNPIGYSLDEYIAPDEIEEIPQNPLDRDEVIERIKLYCESLNDDVKSALLSKIFTIIGQGNKFSNVDTPTIHEVVKMINKWGSVDLLAG